MPVALCGQAWRPQACLRPTLQWGWHPTWLRRAVHVDTETVGTRRTVTAIGQNREEKVGEGDVHSERLNGLHYTVRPLESKGFSEGLNPSNYVRVDVQAAGLQTADPSIWRGFHD